MPTDKNLAAKDPEILLKRIKTEFPELSWHDYIFLDHGWDHEVIILDDKLVFRFPNSSEYLNAFKNEAALLSYISTRVGTPIPKYTYLAEDRSFGGYNLIPGIELTKEAFKTLTSEQRDKIAKQIAAFLSVLHTIPVDALKQFDVQSENYSDDFKELRDRTNQYLKDKLSDADSNLTIAILGDVERWSSPELPQTLIHGDIASTHLIWNESNNKLGIIDFSDRSISDPTLDFAELYAYGNDFIENVYSIYTGPKDNDFLKRAKDYYKRIGVYLMVDSFLTDKVTFEKAKAIFDITKNL